METAPFCSPGFGHFRHRAGEVNHTVEVSRLIRCTVDTPTPARPRSWLFPGRGLGPPLTTRQLNRACHAAAMMAEIDKPVSLHTLRHSFATHLLEQKTDIRVIQSLSPRRRGCCSGSKSVDTTALYTRVALKALGEVTSPLEHLAKRVKPPA
jgi:site-specific recombinase XerD